MQVRSGDLARRGVSSQTLGDRLSGLSRAELGGLVALVAITVGGAGLWYVRSLPRPVEVRADAERPATGAPATSSPGLVPILVDVAGWVRRPGVYEFHDGDRVIDAIDAAGGARRGAALDALNLAAPLADGTQILVLRKEASESAGSATSASSVDGGATPSKVNINSASAVELEALPGIGEVIAQEILDYRTANGPFASVDDLLDVSGIGEVTLENIRDLVTV
jgi:competence protein ComEA